MKLPRILDFDTMNCVKDNNSSKSNLSATNGVEAVKVKKSDGVITNLKNAANAFLDSLELGLFKEVELDGDGSILNVKEGSIIPDSLKFKRYKDGDLHISVEIDGRMRFVEELYSRKGIFLDTRDAQRMQIEKNIADLEERKAEAERNARVRQEEIDELKKQIAKL